MEALPELFYHISRPLTSLRLIFTVTLGLPVCIKIHLTGIKPRSISKEVPDGVPGFTDTLDHHQEILPDFLIEFLDYAKSWSSTRKFTFQLSGNYRKDKKQN